MKRMTQGQFGAQLEELYRDNIQNYKKMRHYPTITTITNKGGDRK